MDATKLKKARMASGMTIAAAAAILGVSEPTYSAYERDPSKMRAEQYLTLLKEMDPISQQLMRDALDELEPTEDMGRIRLGDMYLGPLYRSTFEREVKRITV